MKICENCSSLHNVSYGSGRFCSSKCARGFSTKNKRDLINKKTSDSLRGNIPWNKGLVIPKLVIPKLVTITICPICKLSFQQKSKQRIYCSRLCYCNDINFLYKKKSPGGYRKGSGRGKRGWYNGYWCDSSWELAWIIYNLEHNVPFKRNTQSFNYMFDGRLRKYIPDFILENNEYVEIKGWTWSQELKSKIEQFPLKLHVLYKSDLTNVFEYVIEKYGVNFIRLYQKT